MTEERIDQSKIEDKDTDGLDIDPLDDLEEATKDLVQTIRRVSSRVLIFALFAYAAAAVIGLVTVFMHPVRDRFLFVAMYIVLFVYMLSYIKAHQRRARVRSVLTLAAAVGLIGFWIFILVDRIPARNVFLSDGDAVSAGAIVLREPLTSMWGSVAALGLCALGLIVHWAWVARLQRRLK